MQTSSLALPGTIHGRCHCGNLRYTLQWPASLAPTLRACACDYCSRQGALWTSQADAPVTLTINDPARVLPYRFGTASADFLVCGCCGILTLTRCTFDGGERTVVNANTFENVALEQCARIATDFDGEDQAQRMARRQRNWSPLSVLKP